MTGLTKKRKVAGEIRDTLAQNVNRLMDQRYAAASNRPMSLARDAGISLSSVQRILSREAGASIDTVEALSKVFDIAPFQMLVPWNLLGELARPSATAVHQPRAAYGREHRRAERNLQSKSATRRRDKGRTAG